MQINTEEVRNMEYELYPLRDLFPKLLEDEFKRMRRFEGMRNTGTCIADFWMSEDCYGFWHFKVFDATTGLCTYSKKPISGEGISILLNEFGGCASWNLKPSKDRIREMKQNNGLIYFIQSGKSGAVKIGWSSTSAESRLMELQCGNPQKLSLVKTIENKTRSDECAMHKHFKHLHIRGEWFHPSVLLEIEGIYA